MCSVFLSLFFSLLSVWWTLSERWQNRCLQVYAILVYFRVFVVVFMLYYLVSAFVFPSASTRRGVLWLAVFLFSFSCLTSNLHFIVCISTFIICNTKRITFTVYSSIYVKDLTSINMMKETNLVNRSTHRGFCILDLSKITIYRFHDQQIVAECDNKVRLAYVPTQTVRLSDWNGEHLRRYGSRYGRLWYFRLLRNSSVTLQEERWNSGIV